MEHVLDLPVDRYKAYLRSAIIEQYLQTPSGKEKLKRWKRMENTEFDESNLEFFKKFT